jgi:hypothetical protein
VRWYQILREQGDQSGAVNALMDMVTLYANRLHRLEDQLETADDDKKSSQRIKDGISKSKMIPLDLLVTGLVAGGNLVDQDWVSMTLSQPSYQELVDRIDKRMVHLKSSAPPQDMVSPDTLDKSENAVDKMAARQIKKSEK